MAVQKKKRAKKTIKKLSKKPAAKQAKKQTKKEKKKLIGRVDHYFDKIGVAAMTLGDTLELGDVVQIEGGKLMLEQEIISMQIEHEPVKIAKKGDEVGFKVKKKVREGYRVFKK